MSGHKGRPEIGLRHPDTVMRLERLGSFHQSRLSFMRVLLRKLKKEKWEFHWREWDISRQGVGHAVYVAQGPEKKGTYSLVAFSHDLPDHKRSDRVIATAWDATFALHRGVPKPHDIERLRENVPKQEAGRVSSQELCMSRANKSSRIWNHVVDSLAAGKQPDSAKVSSVGYLMRTTAVYGSGKFGAADRSLNLQNPLMKNPFQVEMLTVYMIRAFVVELAERMARQKGGGQSAPLDPGIRSLLGIGNATGLGMAPFLVNHPMLLHRWIHARESALAKVRGEKAASNYKKLLFLERLQQARQNADSWICDHPLMKPKLKSLRAGLEHIAKITKDTSVLDEEFPWNALFEAAQSCSLEAQEQLVSLMLEPYGHLVDDLAEEMFSDEEFTLDGSWTIGKLKSKLKEHASWALERDYTKKSEMARCWYVSMEKLEPRLGERHEEPIEEYEQPLRIAKDLYDLSVAIEGEPVEQTVTDFVLEHPEHRLAVHRLQMLAKHPYSEIRDSLTSASMVPLDMLRCKLSFFGATRFDPRSDRWLRITMFQNAPYPEEIQKSDPDSWVYKPYVTKPENVA